MIFFQRDGREAIICYVWLGETACHVKARLSQARYVATLMLQNENCKKRKKSKDETNIST